MMIKKKWTSIRDNYTRSVNETRKTKSGTEAEPNKKYLHSDTLSF